MFISKKKLKNYIEQLQADNRASKLGQNYDQPISEAQQDMNLYLQGYEDEDMNLYLQGYEDGTDNFFNAVCEKFKIKSALALPYSLKGGKNR